MPDPVLSARNRVIGLHRWGTPDPGVLADAKRALTVAHCERAIRKALDAEFAPTADQRTRLAALLTGGDQ